MPITLYNTLTRQKEEFVPLNPENVRMYVCGMTVYDYCHLGHARVLVVFDMIARWLRQHGYPLTYVRNITDIDDKIIARANENGETIGELTARFIAAMNEDSDALGVLRPDIEPKATEHIGQMIAMIEDLVANDKAYPAPNGDVYYAVREFADLCRTLPCPVYAHNLDDNYTRAHLTPITLNTSDRVSLDLDISRDGKLYQIDARLRLGDKNYTFTNKQLRITPLFIYHQNTLYPIADPQTANDITWFHTHPQSKLATRDADTCRRQTLAPLSQRHRIKSKLIKPAPAAADAPAPRAEVLRLRPGQPPARISPQAALTPEA